MGGDGATGQDGRRDVAIGLDRDPRQQLRGIGVEAKANLTAALFDELRQPVGELGQVQPLTLVFRAEPAEKRGTLPPGIVIRSPVRGFTP